MGAAYSIRLLPLDKLPEIIIPRVTVETAYPGMGAAEIRSSVTIPLEDSLSAVKGLEGIKSISRDGSSLLLLSFRWGTQPARAAALVREAIDTVYPGLPHGVTKPAVITGDSSEEPHAIVAIRSLTNDNNLAGALAEYEFRSGFRRLDGAGRVTVSGGEKQEIRVRSDEARLSARSLNSSDLATIIAYETADFPAGSAREGRKELTVVSSGRPKSTEELSELILSVQGVPLKLTDLASTKRERAKKDSLFIFQNKEQTALEIYRRPGADPVRLSRDIKKVIEEYSLLFSRDVELNLVYDSSPSILQGAKELLASGGLAAFAVVLLLALFLGRLSYSMLAALSLPVSASAAVIVLAVTGRSLNAMSLAGLALGIGLVSDVSVIVLDLFCRRFDSREELPSAEEAGSLAASVSLSSMAGALTTIVVFVPVIFLPGPLGALFGDLAISLIVSVAAGWLYAQFCLPSLLCFLFNRGLIRHIQTRRKFGGKIEKLYITFLKKVLRKPIPIFAIAFLASSAGFLLLFSKPMEFIAPEAISEIEVTADFPPGTPPDEAVSEGLQISQILSAMPGILNFYGRMGAETDDTGRRANPDYRREKLVFRCFPENNTKIKADALIEMVRLAFKDYTKPVISAGIAPQRSTAILGFSASQTLAVKGSTPEETNVLAETFSAILRKEAGADLESLLLYPFGTRPQLKLIPRREFFARAGVSASQIASMLYAASEGIITGSMEIEGRPLDIRVSGNLPKDKPELLKNIPVSLAGQQNSTPVFLGSLVDIEWIEAKTALARQDRGDVIYISLFPSAGGEKTIRNLAANAGKPGLTGYSVTAGNSGVSRADESVLVRYRSALIATLILVLVLLYLVLGAQFESLLLPIIFLLSVPFSLSGAGPALLISGSQPDSGSVLGLVALFGISVNNGILFYEISEEKIRCGLSPVKAVFLGAMERFRPVLLTSATTIFALLPLVISPMGNSQRSMASTMLGGIMASSILAFFAIPPIFIRFFRAKKRALP